MNVNDKLKDHIRQYHGEGPFPPKGYSKEEILEMSQEQLMRLIKITQSPYSDHGEVRIFFTTPLDRAMMSCLASRKREVVNSWRKAEQLKCLDYYFSKQGAWPEQIGGKNEIQYAGDLADYYKCRGLNSWREAEQENRLPEYFAGRMWFPKVPGNYRFVNYNNDEDDFLRQLEYERYLEYLRTYSDMVPTRYVSYGTDLNFYQTAMSQLQTYARVIDNLPAPVYVVGDGIGLGSYICQLLDKAYVSCEPNKIGTHAHKMGYITYQRKYDRKDMIGCKSVFFGNCLYEVLPDTWAEELLELKKTHKVAVVDQKGLPIIQERDATIHVGSTFVLFEVLSLKNEYFVGEHFTEWYSFRIDLPLIYKYYEFYAHEGKNRWIGIDSVSESMLHAVHQNKNREDADIDLLFHTINTMDITIRPTAEAYSACKTGTRYVALAYDGESYENLRKYFLLLYDRHYKLLVNYIRQYPRIVRDILKGMPFVFIINTVMDIGPVLPILSMIDRSYLQDMVHGKKGNIKFIDDFPRIVPSYVPLIGAHGAYQISFEMYEQANTICNYSQEGMEFVATVKNPYSKHYVKHGDLKIRVMLMAYDPKTNVARYRTASSMAYDNDREVTDY